MKTYIENEVDSKLKIAAEKYVNELMAEYPSSEEVWGRYEYTADFESKIFALESSFTIGLQKEKESDSS
jgi:Tfp pilus assembly protein PilO